jgi:AcrR family transcriptional regulator
MTSLGEFQFGPSVPISNGPPRNRHGQVLGPKGRVTRGRLMESGRQLLDVFSPADLTAVAVAKAAGVTIGAYYLYFDDVSDLLFELSCLAAAELSEVHRVLAEHWLADGGPGVNAGRFVQAFLEVWNANRPVLLYLGLEADRGHDRFAELRMTAIRPIVAALGARIHQFGMGDTRSQGDARAEAMLLVTAATGFASANPAHSEREFGIGRITRTLSDMIGRAISPPLA